MTASTRQRPNRLTTLFRTRIHSYDVASYLLLAGTVAIYVASAVLLTLWRHSVWVTEVCEPDDYLSYQGSQPCSLATGSGGWIVAAIQAVPLASVCLLVLFGITYAVLGKQLDLRKESYSGRRDALIYLAMGTAIIGVCGLVVIVASTYFPAT
jgi:hypothetical protein